MKLVKLEYGDNKSELLEQLVDQLGSNIKRLIYTYVKDWSIAEDLTQETFITCYKKMAEFREDSSYKNWLYKIAINKSKDFLRSKWYRRVIPSDFGFENFKEVNKSAEEELVVAEEDYALSSQVLLLPKKYREIIILYYYEELKIREIEALTGINQETIKTRLRRAKQRLREQMEAE